MSTPLFTLVMPMYNTSVYLGQAIEGVLNQTYGDWELLIIDDASTDNSLSIAQTYAKGDPRIRIIRHPENAGLSAARNTGIENARGTYICFPDSDDVVDPHLLELAFDVIQANDPDVVMFGLVEDYYSNTGEYLYSNSLPMSADTYSTPDEWRPCVIDWERGTFFGYAWAKLYRREIIVEHDLRFQNVRLIEDVLFNSEFFKYVTSVSILEGVLYHYRKVDGRSLTNANAYGAKEYYELHRIRTEALRDLLVGWGVFDGRARAILGSLYGRYVLSAIERSFHDGESFDAESRVQWLSEIMADPLYDELIPTAEASNSRVLSISLKALKSRNVGKCLRLGKGINFARRHLYSTFTKARSGR